MRLKGVADGKRINISVLTDVCLGGTQKDRFVPPIGHGGKGVVGERV